VLYQLSYAHHAIESIAGLSIPRVPRCSLHITSLQLIHNSGL
jgi:hypothetical protein